MNPKKISSLDASIGIILPLFRTTYLDKTLNQLTKSKKLCALLGDYNIDLIKYGNHPDVTSFYDQISSHGFRPLILQPTWLTSTSATLIDNIFINDLSCSSKGGNITSSISDHLIQFSQIQKNLQKRKSNCNKNPG